MQTYFIRTVLSNPSQSTLDTFTRLGFMAVVAKALAAGAIALEKVILHGSEEEARAERSDIAIFATASFGDEIAEVALIDNKRRVVAGQAPAAIAA